MQILGILHVYFEKKCLILHEETTNYLSKNMRIRMTLFGLLLTMVVQAQRSKTNFDFDWKFSLNQDAPANAEKNFDDRQWQDVQLPHDWCISQEFDSKLSGSIAHLHGGIGWYRKTFVVNKKEEGKKISVLFDGIYNRSDVYINGHHLGFRPYGFCYLEYDLTPYIIYGGENVIAVRANNLDGKDQHARWYTGGGIYRHAWILTSNPVHVQTYGTYITTPQVSVERSTVSIRTTVENESQADKRVSVVQIIKDEKGKTLAKSKKQSLNVSKGKNVDFQTELTLNNCKLWSVETPYIYNMTTEVYDGAKKVDSYESTFGVRTAEFTSDRGFLLNGKQVKLKGFCMHQDDASLGAALPYRSMQRRLEICKEYGVNAIRCSHNQPAPEFLDLCDEMGFIVIDEAFDKWKSGYYAEYFDEWWKADLSNMIIRDRNHPCVVTWSEGNELQEAWDGTGEGVARAKMLQDFIHELEPTRQVCIACQNRHNEQFSGVTDVVGYNYLEARMLSDHQKFPERKFLVTEELPYFCGAEGNIRAYDTNNPWNIIEENEWIAGGFLWSGMDYIGEASWPSHGWPTGLFDINMIEKPRAAFHRAMWNKDKPLVSIAVKDQSLDIDHGRDLWQWPRMASIWNFPSSYEGLMMEVNTITNCEKVVLYVNGNEMGVKETKDYPNHTIVWNLPFTPGRIEAKGVNGTDTVAHFEIKTAGEPVKLKATPDRSILKADGQDLSYIQLELLDKDGTLVQHLNRKIKGTIEGEGKLIGLINSDLRRTTPFTSKEDNTYFGRAMAIVQTTRKAGEIRLKLEVENMAEPVIVVLKSE